MSAKPESSLVHRRDSRSNGLTRRSFIILGGAAIVFLAGCATDWPSRGRRSKDGFSALGPWLAITSESDVVVLIDKCEMGQGVRELFACIAAEELGLNPHDVMAMEAPVGARYRNRAFPTPVFQVTGYSSSTEDAWAKLRGAAAGTREMLVRQAAKRWNIAEREVGLRRRMAHEIGNAERKIALADLVPGAGWDVVATPKNTGFGILGVSRTPPRPRIDAFEKVTGLARFGIDVNARELGQDPWTALVVRPTYPDERIQIENEAPVRAMAGVQGLVRLERNHGVAVVADSFWHAYQARREYEKELGHRAGPPPGVDRTSSDVLMKSYRDAVESRPDPSAVENTYCTPYGAHAPLEPMSAACVRDARNTYHIYTATQFPPAARGAAAAVLGIPEHRVRIHGLLAGGSFGRRYASDFVVEVAQICQAMGGRAVKLIWTREDDFRHDFLRPCAVSHVSARMTSSTIARWTHRLASESATFAQIGEVASAIPGVARLAHEYGGTFALPKSLDSADGTLKEGISDSVYSLPQRFGSIKIVSVPERGGVRIGYWRSVGYFHTIFAVESMMDELARKADANPVDFRRQAFDQKYAARATWCLNAIGRDGRSAKLKEYGTGYGMACFRAWGSFAALAVRVSVDTPEEEIRVREVWAAVDCGFVVCPDIVKQQIEGGIIFGLSAALKQEITTEHGIVKETNFHQCDLLRMHECPSIEVVYNQGHGPDVAPGGVGELIVPLVAPAVANAVYNLRRRRLTALPLRLKART